jgi:hypothetical protein
MPLKIACRLRPGEDKLSPGNDFVLPCAVKSIVGYARHNSKRLRVSVSNCGSGLRVVGAHWPGAGQ